MKQISDCETYFCGITLPFLVYFKHLPFGVNVGRLRVVQSWLSADSVALTLWSSTFVTASCKFCQDDTAVVIVRFQTPNNLWRQGTKPHSEMSILIALSGGLYMLKSLSQKRGMYFFWLNSPTMKCYFQSKIDFSNIGDRLNTEWGFRV